MLPACGNDFYRNALRFVQNKSFKLHITFMEVLNLGQDILLRDALAGEAGKRAKKNEKGNSVHENAPFQKYLR
jgi:hypothetical protein